MADSFTLRQAGSVETQVRRFVRQEIHRTIRAIDRGGSGLDIHQVRKSIKRSRAAIRLIRPILGKRRFARENASLRDAAQKLAAVRDADVLLATFEKLVQNSRPPLPVALACQIREILASRLDHIRSGSFQSKNATAQIVKELRIVNQRTNDWPVSRKDRKALHKGLKRVYRQGRRAMKRARSRKLDADFHEWRKRTKDLRHAMEILEAVRPRKMKKLVDEARELADVLGDDHDLCLLQGFLTTAAIMPITAGHRRELNDRIARRHRVLRRCALQIGGRLYDRRPGNYAKWIAEFWISWHESRQERK